MIKTVNLTKKFGEVIAVNNLNLEVKKGELFVFLGPNGAGKTTTIKLITGLLKPTFGEIYIGGFSVQKEYKKVKSIIGYIPDSPFLYEKLTGREFLEFILDIYDMSEKKKKIDYYLEIFDLKGMEDRLIEEYSHGMRQKLAFASAMIHEPQLLVIDEPMVGLDPKSARLIKELLRKKTKEGVTVFLSTHTLPVAEELADRIGIIDEGRLISIGTFEELKKLAKVEGSLEDVFLKLTEENESIPTNLEI